jgi:trans-aconitate 2-methyltransferase
MNRRVKNWDPAQYGKFAAERMRPVEDLLARMTMAAPATVYDLGCGDGRVTRLLASHWPEARITGVDNSANMLDAARKVLPDVTWVEADIAHWTPDAPAQAVFANASLQWLSGHESLLPQLMDMVAPGGVLAVQMPRNHHKPSHDCMRDAAAAGPWRDRLAGIEGIAPVHEPDVYYDILAPHAASLNVWESEYLHALEGDDPVVEWTKGTGLRPYLEPLEPDERKAFLADYSARIAREYPPRHDGVTLFPFLRLFIIAVK